MQNLVTEENHDNEEIIISVQERIKAIKKHYYSKYKITCDKNSSTLV